MNLEQIIFNITRSSLEPWIPAINLFLVLVIVIALLWCAKSLLEDRRYYIQRRDADAMAAHLSATRHLPVVHNPSVMLAHNESAILTEKSRFEEASSIRRTRYTGFRLTGRIWLGGGRTKFREKLTKKDRGTLVLTNQRVLFVGGLKTIYMYLNTIVDAVPTLRTIDIHSTSRQNAQVFTVGNPLMWELLIRTLKTAPAHCSTNITRRITTRT